jgi:hypothetical protein
MSESDTDSYGIIHKPDEHRRQLRDRVDARNRLRLEQTRARLAAKGVRRQAKDEIVKLVLMLPRDVMERAKQVCLTVERVDLLTFFRERAMSYADQLPAGSGIAGKPRRELSEEDIEWREAFEAYGATLEPGAELTVTDLLDFLEWPPLARNREALMRVGRVMRRMGWGRGRVERGGKRIWVYRKPLA